LKAPLFAYAKPATLAQVFDLLDSYGETAKLLAGGQSLIATLNLRLSTPALLIDMNGLDGLSDVTVTKDVVRIGAMTRQRTLERSADVAKLLPLLAQAIPNIAHPAIRNRGTIGGSLAFADPAAELPACCIALAARLVLASRKGERRVAARDFFKGLYETDLQPGEVLVAIEFPLSAPGYRSRFAELARRHGDYAMVGLAAHGKVDDDRVSDLRLVFFGVGAAPIVAASAARLLDSQPVSAERLTAATSVLAKDLNPPGDLNGSGATKLHLAGVLLGRVMKGMLNV
jgi:carbon-monoxide dehydrogenase medium subunit